MQWCIPNLPKTPENLEFSKDVDNVEMQNVKIVNDLANVFSVNNINNIIKNACLEKEGIVQNNIITIKNSNIKKFAEDLAFSLKKLISSEVVIDNNSLIVNTVGEQEVINDSIKNIVYALSNIYLQKYGHIYNVEIV
jgi:hypothetical protein